MKVIKKDEGEIADHYFDLCVNSPDRKQAIQDTYALAQALLSVVLMNTTDREDTERAKRFIDGFCEDSKMNVDLRAGLTAATKQGMH